MFVFVFLLLIAIPTAEIATTKGDGGVITAAWEGACEHVGGVWDYQSCTKEPGR